MSVQTQNPLQPANTQRSHKKTTALVQTALVTAVLCIVSPFSLPIGPIPISLCSFAIMLAACIVGAKSALASVLLYLLLGCIGLPVFSNGGAGLAKLAGPTGGYLLGYLFLALCTGLFFEKSRSRQNSFLRFFIRIFGMLLGTFVLYAFGTAWFMYLTGNALMQAILLCVLPFLPLDLGKILLTALLAPSLCKRIFAGTSS